jgi:hypothetical protein
MEWNDIAFVSLLIIYLFASINSQRIHITRYNILINNNLSLDGYNILCLKDIEQ